MCGIAGQFNRQTPADRAALETALARLAHRGPDDSGLFIDGRFGMGHTRLSIIDLAGGHQPLTADGGNLSLIANGEIYNFVELREQLEQFGHRFSTYSDSEVILHAYLEYGDHFLKHIQGMFAFALYDQRHDRLLLARDRLGIKPLFLACHEKGCAFASEIKGLLPLLPGTPAIDPAGLAQYLQNQFATGPTTLLSGVERVNPGECLWIERGRLIRRQRYWAASQIPRRNVDFSEAEQEFDSLMDRVITEHMRSDVPFGLFLSGGVDSAVLLAMLASRSDQPIHTFSVGFPGTSLTDELPLALAMSRRFGSQHHELHPGSRDIYHTLPLTVWAADDLMRDHANMPTALLAQTAAKQLKVVFSGEGGDEVFGGYGRYRTSRLERLLKGIKSPGSGGFRTRGTFRQPWPARLFAPPLRETLGNARQVIVEAWQATPGDWTDLQRMQYVDLCEALPDNLLVKADRMLMAWGLEGRVPFLDHRIVEFGLGLPDKLKISGRQGKHFLKRWAARYLPEEHLLARKRGFYVPMDEWLDDCFLAELDRILPGHPALAHWFLPDGVHQLIHQCRQFRNGSTMLWAIIQFALWHGFLQQGFSTRPDPLSDPLVLLRETGSNVH